MREQSFWSDKAQDKAVVRSMRPASLLEVPATFRDGRILLSTITAASTPTPMGGCGSGQEAAARMVMDENRRLWTELEAFKSMMQSGATSGVGGSQTSMILAGAHEDSGQQGPSETARSGGVWRGSDVDLLGQGVRMNFSSLGGAIIQPCGSLGSKFDGIFGRRRTRTFIYGWGWTTTGCSMALRAWSATIWQILHQGSTR